MPMIRIALAMEKEEWKPFRNALDKSDRKKFDEMRDIPRLYVMACSNSCQLVLFHPIIMSILFHHYKELKECISEVERTETKVNNGNDRGLTIMKEQEARQKVPTCYFSKNNTNYK